jgi:sugar/nucleoside kinase (ribokinase family)
MIFLHETLAIDTIVIHSNKKACAQRKGEDYCVVDSLYCAKPKLTTGAGDNFNAGFVLGQICDLTVEESLYLAVCNSGFYVRNARSPKTHELLQFMRDN